MARAYNNPAIMFGLGVIIVMISLTAGIIIPVSFNITTLLIISLFGAALSLIGLVRFISRI